MEIKDFVKVYDNLIPLEKIASFIKYCNTLKYEKAKILGNPENPDPVNTNMRNVGHYVLHDVKNFSAAHWNNFLLKYIKDLTQEYSSYFNCGTCASNVETIEILKYEKGMFYKTHTDHHKRAPRTLSFVIFLNDDYKGGSLNFYNPFNIKEKTIEVKPKAGRFVVWPSNFVYPHEAGEVIEGTRFAVVSWVL